MHQYERMYNSCRVPGEECDTIQVYSKDKRHIVVLRNNRIMQVEVLDESGAIKVLTRGTISSGDCRNRQSSPQERFLRAVRQRHHLATRRMHCSQQQPV
jgi:hypothetical protein